MHNILHAPPSVEQIAAVLKTGRCVPLIPAYGDAAWDRAKTRQPLLPLLEAIRERALAEAAVPLPVLTDELYAEFPRTGIRVNFERLYFDRRRRLARAAIAFLMESDPAARETLASSFLAKMRDVFAETSWALPAHTHGSPTGKAPEVIDLFAAETACLFAELLTVFAAILPVEFVAAIRSRLRTQIFENYLSGEHYWKKRDSNWNAVCHQGVIGAALSVETDDDLLARMLHHMALHLPAFLHGYGADGATAEGPGYWAYGFGWFTELNEQLERRTNGQFSLFHNDPKINAIARFGPSTLLENQWTINFSDGSARAGFRPTHLQYLADRLQDPLLASHAASCWRNTLPAADEKSRIEALLEEHRSDFFFFHRLCMRAPETMPEAHPLPPQDIYWSDAQWLLSRFKTKSGHTMEFAAKAGNNDENHNHNDVGSFLVNLDGQRAIIELGAPEYTRQFFAAETRYQHLAARSLGHSVPLINGAEQSAGKEFTARDVACRNTGNALTFSLDFAPAYPASAGVTRALRTFLLDKSAAILTISDDFQLSKLDSLETAIMSLTAPTIDNNVALLKLEGVTLKITPDANTRLKEVQRHTYNNHGGTPTSVHRLVLVPHALAPATKLAATISIAD